MTYGWPQIGSLDLWMAFDIWPTPDLWPLTMTLIVASKPWRTLNPLVSHNHLTTWTVWITLVYPGTRIPILINRQIGFVIPTVWPLSGAQGTVRVHQCSHMVVVGYKDVSVSADTHSWLKVKVGFLLTLLVNIIPKWKYQLKQLHLSCAMNSHETGLGSGQNLWVGGGWCN